MPTLRMDAKLHNNSLTCGMQIVVFPKEVGGIYSTIDVMATNASPMPVAVSNPRNDIFKATAAFDAFLPAKACNMPPTALRADVSRKLTQLSSGTPFETTW
ncbi:hypothetical protein [uncultured Duncaniella sp.]|uniref:hypothetical protein n=1 Tax=uncultured Duncaniella sp. TaxID=2768039 RepID=UPI0025A5E31C|nr:hypothetical protein [uncultured Duncaniella sp.]